VDRQEEDSESVLNLARRLVRFRKAQAALRTGIIRPVEAPENVLAFERGEGEDRLLCAFNLGDTAVQWSFGPEWQIVERVGEPLQPLSGAVATRAP
jgi:alpha-glucosidase